MELYGFEFSEIELIFIGLFLLAFVYQLWFYTKNIYAVKRQAKRIKKNKVSFQTAQLPVSVVVCAKDEVDNLRRFLPFILNQEYPDFEIIVVNDGSTDETEHLLNELKKEHANLHSTFVPVGATNLSTKKLALTLGIKAAKNDWVLFTDADCMPEDKHWIARMARNFTQGTEFVLGYGAYFRKRGFLNKLITYDTLFIALQYMGFALRGKPYMGVGRNMAYRKDVFLRNNGFARTLHLRSGDDDLLVNRLAKKSNTRVEVAADSITWSEPHVRYIDWYYQKERHLSVSSFYSGVSKYRLAIEPLFRALFYLSFIGALVFGNMITMIVAGALFLARFIMQLTVVNASSKHFGGSRYFISIMFFDILLPLISLYIMTFGRMGSKAKYIYWK